MKSKILPTDCSSTENWFPSSIRSLHYFPTRPRLSERPEKNRELCPLSREHRLIIWRSLIFWLSFTWGITGISSRSVVVYAAVKTTVSAYLVLVDATSTRTARKTTKTWSLIFLCSRPSGTRSGIIPPTRSLGHFPRDGLHCGDWAKELTMDRRIGRICVCVCVRSHVCAVC